MRIVVISGLQYEMDALQGMMVDYLQEELCGNPVAEGVLNGQSVYAVLTGTGKVNAAMLTQAAIDEYSPDLVINIGLAGGCNPELKQGDAVVATKLVYHDADLHAVPGTPGQIIGYECDPGMTALAAQTVQEEGLHFLQGIIATGDRFINSAALRADIVKRTDCLCVDRGSCAVAQVCTKNTVPFISVKIISDTADEDASGEYAFSAVQYSKLSARIIRRICSSVRAS